MKNKPTKKEREEAKRQRKCLVVATPETQFQADFKAIIAEMNELDNTPEYYAPWYQEALDRKDEGREIFANAELTQDVEMRAWNGTHPSEAPKNNRSYTMKAGETVLITMASRFGDVGVRGTSVDQEIHGYHARIDPRWLTNVRFLSDGGRPWRKEMLQKYGQWKEEPIS